MGETDDFVTGAYMSANEYQDQLRQYYRVNQQHLQLSFWSSLVALLVGLIALMSGVYLVLNGNPSITSHLTTIAGIFTQFIGAGFFYLYSKNLKQLNVFYEKIIKHQDTMFAVSLINHTPENERASAILAVIGALLSRGEPKTEITPELVKAFSDAKSNTNAT